MIDVRAWLEPSPASPLTEEILLDLWTVLLRDPRCRRWSPDTTHEFVDAARCIWEMFPADD